MAGKKQSQLDAITAVVDADEMNVEQSGTSKRIPVGLVQTQLPFNYIGGLITSNNVGDPDHDIDIAVGEARDSTNVDNMRLAAVLTKQIDAAWAVGTDQGGMDTGAVAGGTLYAKWLIKRSDTGVVDALFSTSFTAPSMPTNYDRKRLIAAILTDAGSDIAPYVQSGHHFRLLDSYQDFSDAVLTDQVYKEATLHIPPRCLAHINANLSNSSSTAPADGRILLRTKGSSKGTGVSEAWYHVRVEANFDTMSQAGEVFVDNDSKIEYAVAETTGSASLELRSFGWTMFTREEP